MALVVRFDPLIDPWDQEGPLEGERNKRQYPYPSQHRWPYYWWYYDEDYRFYEYDRKKKKRHQVQYIRMQNKKELDKYLKEQGVDIDARAKVLTNLERYKTRNEDYDFYITLKNRKVDFRTIIRRVDWYKYNKEAIAIYNSFSKERKYIWQWISYYLGNHAKNSGMLMFVREYIMAKKENRPYKEYPQTWENIEPEPANLFEVIANQDYQPSCWFAIHNTLFNPGIIFRAKMEPHPRYNHLPYFEFKWKSYSTHPEVMREAVAVTTVIKQRTYTISTYCVNSWGVRSKGQVITLPMDKWISWDDRDLNHYWDWNDSKWIECEPPAEYIYDGSW